MWATPEEAGGYHLARLPEQLYCHLKDPVGLSLFFSFSKNSANILTKLLSTYIV